MNNRSSAFHLGYQRSLDGLRGLAIVMVLLYHGKIVGNGFGFIGVNTFFVLSGFLISSLLVEEWDKSGTINFRHFYIRRALRLLPALIVLLMVFAIFVSVTMPIAHWKQEATGIFAALFYFTNWAQIFSVHISPFLGHTWSLSIEEQFYILWPMLLLWLLRTQKRLSVACWITLGAIISAAARFLLFMGTDAANQNPDHLTAGLDMRADSLLVGCAAGVAVASNISFDGNFARKLLPFAAIVSFFGLFILATVPPLKSWMVCFGWLMASIFAVILVLKLTTAAGWLKMFFENPVLVQTGRISYGLYLWHYTVLIALQQNNWPWEHLVYLLWVVPVVLASYYLIERPCLRLKKLFVHAK